MEVAVQASFNSGEWSPKLYARVDMQKFRSGAALLENFFVDYRGGASTRPGSKYVIQAYKSSTPVRLLPFQASFAAGYVLEFGNGYVRFHYQGAPVVEAGITITGATQANPCVLTIPGNNYAPGDWLALASIGGMTQLNGRYVSVLAVSGSSVTIGTLNGAAIDSTAYGAYTAGGAASRIYTISSPYTSTDDLRLLKYSQNVGQMVLCHPNHPPYTLTLISASNWVLTPASFGATVSPPAAPTITTSLSGGSVYYAYAVTSIDSTGQESSPSTPGTLSAKQDIRSTAGSNTIAWSAAPYAAAYNIYEAVVSYGAAVPTGVQFGFIGTTKGTSFVDSNIGADFTQTPPISKNPFVGYSIASVTVTAPGTYTAVPTAFLTGDSTTPATLAVTLISSVSALAAAGTGFAVGDTINFGNGLVVQVTSIFGSAINSLAILSQGSLTSGSAPANPVAQVSTSGAGTGAALTLSWGVGKVDVITPGSGYSSAPTVSFSSGAATATANLSAATTINPTVPAFVQQRLVLGGPAFSPATFYMSKPAQYFNFDTSNPVTAGDSVTGTLASGTLNSIKSIVASTAGMLILTDKASWLVNGGSSGSAITPLSIVANPQSYVGANDVPPIVANYDILYVQSKGSAVRDLSFNIYFNTFTGTDISIIASHLFYGYTIDEWAWAEQPYYIANAIRSDGQILTLTFLKEQEFVGWTHWVTNGTYQSVASVTEVYADGTSVDAVYAVVQRTINGVSVQYIERFADRTFPNGRVDAWCVDAGLQYSGTPTTNFSGAEHLAGQIVTGLADGIVIPPFTMPVSGAFTLAAPASKVTVGIGYTCKLQTLPLDIGEPSVQGKVKKISSVDIRVADTLGLTIGSDFTHQVAMKDLVVGNVSSALTGQSNQVVSDLVSGDAITVLDPTYTIPGQYCIQQSLPYPATILGVFPRYTIGNTR